MIAPTGPLARLARSLRGREAGRKLLWVRCRVRRGRHLPPPRRPPRRRLAVAPRTPATGQARTRPPEPPKPPAPPAPPAPPVAARRHAPDRRVRRPNHGE